MARRRLDIPGIPQHVVHRGVDRRPVFRDDVDRAAYLADIGRAAARYGVAIHGYALMTNHIHVLASAPAAGAVARMMQLGVGAYVRRFNEAHGRVGTLWEGRYWSGLVASDRYLLACLAYVELNPVRAGLVAAPERWRWSSAACHVTGAVDPLVRSHPTYDALDTDPRARCLRWKRILGALDRPATQCRLRARLYKGYAFGSAAFHREVETRTGGPAVPRRVGRPRRIIAVESS